MRLRSEIALSIVLGVAYMVCLLGLYKGLHLKPTPLHSATTVVRVPGHCMSYLGAYVMPHKTSRLPASKFNHMMEMVAVCENGQDPTKVVYHEPTRAEQDQALRHEMSEQVRCGGLPCAIHTGVPRPGDK